MVKKMAIALLATPHAISKKGCQQISAALNRLVADAFALYVKTKNFHWHLSGSHFRDYHLLFDEQAIQILNIVDVLAERVRKIGGLTIHSIGEIAKLQAIVDDDADFVSPEEMVKRLLKDNQSYIASLRIAHKLCADYEDVASCSVLEVFLDEAERRVWFLFETHSAC